MKGIGVMVNGVFNPVPQAPRLMTFGELLRRERVKLGFSHTDIARRCGVDREAVRAWEEGTSEPVGDEIPRLLGSVRKLRPFRHLLKSEAPPSDESEPVSEEPAPLYKAPAWRPMDFDEALRHERLLSGLSQDELGELLGCSGQAVSAWERAIAVPVRENYDQLLSLFPNLGFAAQPTVRNIPKPDGGSGVEREPLEFHAAPGSFELEPETGGTESHSSSEQLVEPLPEPACTQAEPQETPAMPEPYYPPGFDAGIPQPKYSAEALPPSLVRDMKAFLIAWTRLFGVLSENRESKERLIEFLTMAQEQGFTPGELADLLKVMP